MPLFIPPASPTGVLRYEWVDPTDTVRDFTQQTSPRMFVSRGSMGLGAPDTQIAEEKLPMSPGSVVRRISVPSARMEVPITILEDNMSDLMAAVDSLREWFDTGDETRRTPGYFRVTRPDGSVRQRLCYFEGGMAGNMSDGSPSYLTYVVGLLAPDPWPTGPTEDEIVWPAASLGVPVGRINAGQLDAYPVWEITGPCTNMSVMNDTTNKGWSLVFSLAAGKTVTVDTRPASQRVNVPVLDSDNINRFPALFPGSILFGNWLVPGVNVFTITLVGTGVGTQVKLRHLPRYRGMVR